MEFKMQRRIKGSKRNTDTIAKAGRAKQAIRNALPAAPRKKVRKGSK